MFNRRYNIPNIKLNMPFCEIADVMMFWCHGNMILDDLFVILILVLIIRCWLYNMCINNQINFNPLLQGDILL